MRLHTVEFKVSESRDTIRIIKWHDTYSPYHSMLEWSGSEESNIEVKLGMAGVKYFLQTIDYRNTFQIWADSWSDAKTKATKFVEGFKQHYFRQYWGGDTYKMVNQQRKSGYRFRY